MLLSKKAYLLKTQNLQRNYFFVEFLRTVIAINSQLFIPINAFFQFA